ncbi:DsbC/DsbD-like thiol-disulfide interchange protein [Rhodobacteraceae bacterium MBR-64]
MIRNALSMIALGAALAASLPPTALRAEGFLVVDDVVQITLLSGWVTKSGTRMAALRVDLAPGWKTYWRSPGDGGIPPLFDWSGSRNLQDVAVHWPSPQVFDQAGLKSVGYKDQLVLPLEFLPLRADAPILIEAEVQIGVCQDVCIPVTRAIRAEFPASPEGQQDKSILAALARQPVSARAAGLGPVSCRITPIADGVQVRALVDLPATITADALVFETPDENLWISQSRLERSGRHLVASADFVPVEARPFALQRSTLRLTVVGPDRSIDIQGCPAP